MAPVTGAHCGGNKVSLSYFEWLVSFMALKDEFLVDVVEFVRCETSRCGRTKHICHIVGWT